MTLDQLIAEVAAAPTQIDAFTVLMKCLEIEMKDASSGDSAPPSVQTKYDAVFAGATGKAHEILNAIETGKPALEPVKVKEVPASSPSGPFSTSAKPIVFNEGRLPKDESAPKPVPEPFVTKPVNDPSPGPIIS
jgi:hypothetical protein